MPTAIIRKFQKEYGAKRGKAVFYATANKEGRNPETFHQDGKAGKAGKAGKSGKPMKSGKSGKARAAAKPRSAATTRTSRR
jgi:hypothetical protein